jgi:hypothetical protein
MAPPRSLGRTMREYGQRAAVNRSMGVGGMSRRGGIGSGGSGGSGPGGSQRGGPLAGTKLRSGGGI